MEKPLNQRYEDIAAPTPDQEKTAESILAGSELELVSLSEEEKDYWSNRYNTPETKPAGAPGRIDNHSFESINRVADSILESTPEANADLIKTPTGEKLILSKFDVDLTKAEVVKNDEDDFFKKIRKVFGR